MSALGLVVSLVFMGLCVAWIIFPFLKQDQGKLASGQSLIQSEHEQLTIQYGQVVSTLRELDEDYSTGKVQPDEYERERPQLARRGVEILKQLDKLQADHPSLQLSGQSRDDQAIDDAIEAAVLEYLDEPVSRP